jgi:hypothetical protein
MAIAGHLRGNFQPSRNREGRAGPPNPASRRFAAIVPIAALTAKGDLDALKTAIGEGLNAGLSINEINAEPQKETAMNRIYVIIGNETLSATLDDTPAGRDFAALLPLELSLSDYHATEKVADLPRKLDTTATPASYTPQAGDITYYAPWGNLAIFYKPFRSSRGLVRLGAFDKPIGALLKEGAIPVRIEVAE